MSSVSRYAFEEPGQDPRAVAEAIVRRLRAVAMARELGRVFEAAARLWQRRSALGFLGNPPSF